MVNLTLLLHKRILGAFENVKDSNKPKLKSYIPWTRRKPLS